MGWGVAYRGFCREGLSKIGELLINKSFSVEKVISYFTVSGVSKQVLLFATRTKLDYDHGNITYQMFSLAAVGVMNTVSVFFLARARKKWILISQWSLHMTGCQPT